MATTQSYFWTPERLSILVEVLRNQAFKDAKGLYFGPRGLSVMIREPLREEGICVSRDTIDVALLMLVYFGGLEGTKRGAKRSDYKRRFYPDRLPEITSDYVADYWANRGKK
jgi:hypothetical protein